MQDSPQPTARLASALESPGRIPSLENNCGGVALEMDTHCFKSVLISTVHCQLSFAGCAASAKAEQEALLPLQRKGLHLLEHSEG